MSYDPISKLTDYSTPEFYNSLKILFTNSDSFARFFDEQGTKRMVIIEGVDKLTANEIETINVRSKKWNEKTASLRTTIAADKKELEKWLHLLLDNINNPQKIPASLLSKEIIEGVAADLINQCVTEYRAQNQIFNSNVIKQLAHKIGILEPWSQSSVCGNCEILELLLSSFPEKNTKCAKCNKQMKTIRIYKLIPEYEKLKSINYDLPKFIQTYIEKHISTKIETFYPLSGHDGGDIDVFIPDFNIGMECKLFVNPLVEGNSLKSRIGELTESFKKYINKENVSKLVAITNLDPKYETEIEKGIKSSLKKAGLEYSSLKIICASTKDLIEYLDSEIKLLKKQES